MENENKKTEHVSYDEFKKMDIRIGTIREVEPVEGADKLLRCQIDFGMKMPDGGTMEPERDIRQIVSGIREYYPDFPWTISLCEMDSCRTMSITPNTSVCVERFRHKSFNLRSLQLTLM
jgi:hypothetical protein